MSRTFRVSLQTSAFADVTVDISDKQLIACARQHDISVDKLTTEHLSEIIENTYDAPTLCAQCTGWGRDYSLELSEVWELVDDQPAYPAIVEQ